MVSNSHKHLFCAALQDILQWSDEDTLLPARCVGCPYSMCYNAMRERVRDNVDGKQLEFDFSAPTYAVRID